MFINSISEFCIGYLCNFNVLLIESSLSLLVLGSVLYNEFGIGDLGEFLSNDRGEVRGYEIQSCINSVVGCVLVDNICSGLVSDGISSLVFVGVSLVSSVVSVLSNCISYLVSGFDSCGIVVGGNDVMSLLLISFEGIGYIMRSLSMGIRVFSNLVSGVLLSSIFMPLSVISLVGSLSCSSVVLGVISCSLLLISVIGLVGLESFVGVVQNFVFVVLGDNYSVDVRGSYRNSSRGSNRYILSLLFPLVCVGESSGSINGYLGIVLLLCSLGVGIYCGRGIVGGVSNFIDRQSCSGQYNLVEEIISRNPGLRNIPIEENSSIFDLIDSVVSSPYFIIGLGVVVVVGGLIISGVVYNVGIGSGSRMSLVENDSVQNVCYNGVGYIYNIYRDVIDSIFNSFSSLCSPEFISYCSIVGVYGLFIGMSFYFMFRDGFMYDRDCLESLINGDSSIIGCGCDYSRLSRIGREFFRGCSYVSYSNFGSNCEILVEILRLVGPYLPQLGQFSNLLLIQLSQGRCDFSVLINGILNMRVQNNGIYSGEENLFICGIDQILRNRRGYRPVGYGMYSSYFDYFGQISQSRRNYILVQRGRCLNDNVISELPLFSPDQEDLVNSVQSSYIDFFNILEGQESRLRRCERILRRRGSVDLNNEIVEYNQSELDGCRQDVELGMFLCNSGEVRVSDVRGDNSVQDLISIGGRGYRDLYSDMEQQLGRESSRFIRSGYRSIVLDLRRNNRIDYIRYICGVENVDLLSSDSSLLSNFNYSFFGELLGGVCTVKYLPATAGIIFNYTQSKTNPTTKVPYASRLKLVGEYFS